MSECQNQVDGHSILPGYLSDLIAIASLIFMITAMVTVYFIRRELHEHNYCIKNTDKQDRKMVRYNHHIGTIHSIQLNNIYHRTTRDHKQKVDGNT